MPFVPSEEPHHHVGARLLHGGRCFVGLRPESALPACRSPRSAVSRPGWAGRASLSAVRTSCAAQPPDERPDRDAVDVQDLLGEVDPNAFGVAAWRSFRRSAAASPKDASRIGDHVAPRRMGARRGAFVCGSGWRRTESVRFCAMAQKPRKTIEREYPLKC